VKSSQISCGRNISSRLLVRKILAESVGRALIGGTCIDSFVLTDKRDGVCGIASLEAAGEVVRGSKDDDAVGARGLHRGHGVGGARRLGVHLLGHRQRGRPRHAQWRDRPIRCRLSYSTGLGRSFVPAF